MPEKGLRQACRGGTPPPNAQRRQCAVLQSQSAAVAVRPAWATAGSHSNTPVTAAATAKRMSLRMALLLSDIPYVHTEFGAEAVR